MCLYLASFLTTNKKYEIFDFSGFGSSSWNIRSFLSLRFESSISRNIRHFSEWFFSFFFCTYIWKVLSQQTKDIKFWFFKLWKFFLKYKKFFKLEVWKFHFPKYKTFCQSDFFHFLSSEVPSWNVRNFLGFPFPEIWGTIFGVFAYQNIGKALFWKNNINFLILLQETFISRNIRKYKNLFFIFWAWV